MAELLTGFAPAKLNLVLEVTGRRADGYHEIDTVLQTLELADRVALGAGETGVGVSGPRAEGTPADETNLAWRAAVAMAALAGESVDGLHIEIEKQISAAGGLGGGASDAATVLRMLQRRWPGATDAALLEAANAIGSDEAFFLLGGTARARGRGEIVTPLPDLPSHGVVLFVPRTTIKRKTARMFAALDALPFDDGTVAARFVERTPAALDGTRIYNSFERVAFDVFDGLASIWQALEERTGEPVRLAGAGPTLFWIGATGRASDIAERARGVDCDVIETATAESLWKP